MSGEYIAVLIASGSELRIIITWRWDNVSDPRTNLPRIPGRKLYPDRIPNGLQSPDCHKSFMITLTVSSLLQPFTLLIISLNKLKWQFYISKFWNKIDKKYNEIASEESSEFQNFVCSTQSAVEAVNTAGRVGRTRTRVRTWGCVRVRVRSRLGLGHEIFWDVGTWP